MQPSLKHIIGISKMVAKVTTKYEADSGQVHGLIMEPTRLAVAGTVPTGAVSSPIKAQISKSNREFGLRPRGVRLAKIIGTAPDTFRKYSFLPVLLATEFNTAPFAIGATITIAGTDWTVVAKVPEDY